MKYQKISIEIIYFASDDVVRTSGNETERIPFETGSEGVQFFLN